MQDSLFVPKMNVPDAAGHFGEFGGVFVPETLVTALDELTSEYTRAKNDPAFQAEFRSYLNDFVGRPSRLYFAKHLSTNFHDQ